MTADAGPETFRFERFDPPDRLRPFLRQTFFARGCIDYRADKILPNGLAVAVFNRGPAHRLGKAAEPSDNPAFEHSWLHGVQTTPLFNAPGGETHVVGLLFEPIGLHALFGIDLADLTDRTLDARAVLPASFVERLEALPHDPGSDRYHGELHRLLLTVEAASLPSWLWALYGAIKRHRGLLRLSQAYEQTGHSPRHINAFFKRAVGVSPKVFCRIHRLQALLAAVDPTAPVSWTALAHRFEFYDQAHFNREFRRFAGLHPSQYLAQRQRDLPQLGRGEAVSFAPQR